MITKKIIAIGGGEIGFRGSKLETLAIDREAIKQTGKASPKLLFISTASKDAPGYIEQIQKYFGKKLGCVVSALELTTIKYSQKELKEHIMGADIIYVGGGNTLFMMNVWRQTGVDKLLKSAYEQGIVMTGQSAGSICWFSAGNSDSRKVANSDQVNPIKVTGLGLIKALHCPHFDRDVWRPDSLKQMMQKTKGVAIALDNCSAIEIIDDQFRILKSKKEARAFKVFWFKGEYLQVPIVAKKGFEPVADLLKK